MNRRRLLQSFAAAAMLPATAHAVEKPYRVSLIGDAFDGEAWMTGVRIELLPEWKTYWRMPGDAGIPPLFGWNGGRGEGWVEVFYPMPRRYQDASGETVGYKDEVVFPVRVKPQAGTAQRLDLDFFFAVCKDICIPAQDKASLTLGPAMRDLAGSRLVTDWMGRVPKSGDLISAASIVAASNGLALQLTLRSPVDDIFVETDGGAYFRAPVFNGTTAVLAVDNVKDPAKLSGQSLRLTYLQGGTGLDQVVVLP